MCRVISSPRGSPVSEALRPADLRLERTADGSRTLRDGRIDQTYGSGRGALAEARHVFLQASGVAERLAAGRPTRVLEVGLGTGLNLLISADAAVTAGAELHYRGLERNLPPASLLRRLGYGRHLRHPEIAAAWADLRAALPDADEEPEATPRRWAPPPEALGPGVTLEVALGDATRARTLEEGSWAHAIYHDAFSPDVAPELWSAGFLARLAHALAPGGTLVSYTVKGEVRRRLLEIGLRVQKLPGPPGGKREMLRASR